MSLKLISNYFCFCTFDLRFGGDLRIWAVYFPSMEAIGAREDTSNKKEPLSEGDLAAVSRCNRNFALYSLAGATATGVPAFMVPRAMIGWRQLVWPFRIASVMFGGMLGFQYYTPLCVKSFTRLPRDSALRKDILLTLMEHNGELEARAFLKHVWLQKVRTVERLEAEGEPIPPQFNDVYKKMLRFREKQKQKQKRQTAEGN